MNYIFEMSQCVRGGLIALIYKKSLKLSNEGRASKSTGDIVNLMVGAFRCFPTCSWIRELITPICLGR
jgi:hypothetical protein